MGELIGTTAYVHSLGEWAALYQQMQPGYGDESVRRVVYPGQQSEAGFVNITSARDALGNHTWGNVVRRLLPIYDFRPDGQAMSLPLQSVVLSPETCDLEFLKARINGTLTKEGSGMFFCRADGGFGYGDLGWHTDGATEDDNTDISHLTVAGEAVALFAQIRDNNRIIELSDNVPHELKDEELATVERVDIKTGALVCFRGIANSSRQRFPDAHNFITQGMQKRRSLALEKSELEQDAIVKGSQNRRDFEALVKILPILAPYHPDEIIMRTAAYLY